MSTITMALPAAVTPRPRLLSRPLALLFLADSGGLTSFYLLLSVVPLYVGGAGAGLATGALMIATVLAELAVPRLVAAFGYRATLAAGLVLLGAPALALPVAGGLAGVLAICALRGLGLGIIFVVCGALGAALMPPERRGEGLGVLGVVAGIPAVVAMPLGLWLAASAGYQVVFVVGAAAALAGLAGLRGLPDRLPAEERHGRRAFQRGLLRPSIVFAAAAMAAGAVVTFLPAATGHVAAVALLAHSATATAARWWAGRHGDRHGAARLLAPSVAVSVVGLLLLVPVGSPAAVLVGMVLFGAGFGAIQNVSLAMMFDRIPAGGYGFVTALWSVAYDGGFGLGAVGFGLLVAP